MISEIWSQFENLKNTVDTFAISAIRCGTDKQHLLLKGEFGEPILLLAAEFRENPRTSIYLKHVRVSFDLLYEATTIETGLTSTGSYCKFSCDPQSPGLHRYFVELLAAIAYSNSGKLSQTAIDEIVDALLELFRKLTTPQKNTVSGLWGELLLINGAAHPATFIDGWHISKTDTFDFSFIDARLEVKSTERTIREHEFSLDQVRDGRPGDTVVSVKITRSAAGQTVLDLTRNIASKVSWAHQQKLWRLVFETLGDGIENAEEEAFDVVSAIDELIFLPTSVIPAPTVSSIDESVISSVRFRTNISGIHTESRIDRNKFLCRAN
jgi:hypothetical protein